MMASLPAIAEEVKRLSYSSANVLMNCPRRYWHKVHKTPHDPDYVDNQKALRLGKAFHLVMETAGHDLKKFSKVVLEESCFNEGVTAQEEVGLVLAMSLSYLKLHKKTGLVVKACEIEVGDKHILGYVDMILVDMKSGFWWIGDLKTAGKLSGDLLSRLSRDPQLNLYSYYALDMAATYGLDPDKFDGSRYRVTTKASLKLKKEETLGDYAKRLLVSSVESYDIGIPYNPAIVKQTRDRMERLFEAHAMIIESPDETDTLQNFGNCFHYFSPCPHWSRCHGNTYTEASRCLNMQDSKSIGRTQPRADEDRIFELL